MDILSPNDEMENHIVYSACHEFTGESTLSFEPPAASSPSVSGEGDAKTPGLALPPNLPFQLVFLDPIETAVAAVGDPIRASFGRVLAIF